MKVIAVLSSRLLLALEYFTFVKDNAGIRKVHFGDINPDSEVLPFFVAQSPDSRLYSNTRVSSELYLYSFFHKFPNSFCVFSFSIFSI